MDYAIETFSLTKTFSDLWGRDRVRAVDQLDLKVRVNEVFGLLGPNGSGKTTTIKMLLGLLHPTKGNALVLGGDSRDPKINKRIGFLPEESYLYRFLNARETLNFYGRLFGLPSKVRKLRIEALLEMVGLKSVANRPVGMYSKGMARRIGLAQALINDPDLLILDEPTTGLDPIGTRQIKDLILELAKRGKTILLCSHLLADVEDVCDRISILYGGKVQAEGKVAELLRQSQKRQITTGPVSDQAWQKIRHILEEEGLETEISSPMEKLETFFVDTIASAREQGMKTSGVEFDENAQISSFLSAEAAPDILDKLVSTSDQGEAAKPEPPETPVETTPSQPQPDESILDELTRPSTEQAPQRETEPALTESPQSAEQPEEPVREDLLEELTYPDNSHAEAEDEQTEEDRDNA